MSKVLYITATPKALETSYTLKMAKKFIEEYKKLNLDDEVTVLDLYKEDIKPLSLENLQNFFTPDEEMKKYVDQFIAHDKYVIAAPFWNLSIPAILKPRFYVSTSKSIIKALINMRSFEIQLSPIG